MCIRDRLLGFALLCNVPVPIIFYRHVYKALLKRPVSLADVIYTDKELATSYSELIQKAELFRAGKDGGEDPVTWDMVFTSERSQDGSEEVMTDANGEEILVTSKNLTAYVRWEVAKRLTFPIKAELNAMREGMLQVVPESVLTGLTAEDLQLLLAGRSVPPTVEDLKKLVKIKDIRLPETKALVLSLAEADKRTPDEWIEIEEFEAVFWEMAGMMEPIEYVEFVAYVTGSPVLHSSMEVHVSDPPEHFGAGPFARQCASYVRVPCCVWGDNSPKQHDRITAVALLEIFRNSMALATDFDTV
eukprot:TRINITY_DN34617_c0_g1_i1.p1 TRINITY_DN34617_c0_g1~~TRINITY_DN34617_c0_g1_i1.p1  ORF type:complete len:326 (-),score=82.07 TRINITY_DN34617_c0_g1_i1:66-971(-)